MSKWTREIVRALVAGIIVVVLGIGGAEWLLPKLEKSIATQGQFRDSINMEYIGRFEFQGIASHITTFVFCDSQRKNVVYLSSSGSGVAAVHAPTGCGE